MDPHHKVLVYLGFRLQGEHHEAPFPLQELP